MPRLIWLHPKVPENLSELMGRLPCEEALQLETRLSEYDKRTYFYVFPESDRELAAVQVPELYDNMVESFNSYHDGMLESHRMIPIGIVELVVKRT